MRLRIDVADGDMAPRWYGRAWRRWDAPSAVCLPLGINLVAGAARGCYIWLRRGFFRSPFSPRYSEALDHGFQRGYRQCVIDQAIGNGK